MSEEFDWRTAVQSAIELTDWNIASPPGDSISTLLERRVIGKRTSDGQIIHTSPIIDSFGIYVRTKNSVYVLMGQRAQLVALTQVAEGCQRPSTLIVRDDRYGKPDPRPSSPQEAEELGLT